MALRHRERIKLGSGITQNVSWTSKGVSNSISMKGGDQTVTTSPKRGTRITTDMGGGWFNVQRLSGPPIKSIHPHHHHAAHHEPVKHHKSPIGIIGGLALFAITKILFKK